MKNYDFIKLHFEIFNKNNNTDKSPLVLLWNELSNREYAITIAISQFITLNDGVLRYDNSILNLKEISKLLELDYDAIRKIIPVLEKKEILYKLEIKSDRNNGKSKMCYVANPFIYLNYDYICNSNLDLFINSKWATYYNTEITRKSPVYRRFINNILKRDNNICQCCGSILNPDVHHILNYSQYKNLRADIDNGIVLCECCHSPMIKGSFHNTYGTRNNTKEQLQEYINNKREELGLEPKII